MDAHEIRMKYRGLPFNEGEDFLNDLSDEEVDGIYCKMKSVGLPVLTYDEYKARRRKYDGTEKCFVNGCDGPAYYEDGDARYYCGMCEKCSGIRRDYVHGLWLIAGCDTSALVNDR